MVNKDYIIKAKQLINSVRGKKLDLDTRRQHAITLAGYLLNEARKIETPDEALQQKQLSRLMKDPMGRAFTTAIADQTYRTISAKRAADQIVHNIRTFGVPQFLPMEDRIKLKMFKLIGKPLAKILLPIVKRTIHKETSNVIISGEPNKLKTHLAWRAKEKVRINLNHLGEAILGEDEAQARFKLYLEDLASAEVNYISIKISTLFSQIQLLDEEGSLEILSERLRQLYRAAQDHPFKTEGGEEFPKFVNLDMEEYRDLQLTLKLFKKVLSEPEFFKLSAGVVLQSYLPDSYRLQQELTRWAIERVVAGGAPIKIRIVKGANLSMEKVEASIHNWPLAPYSTKTEVDANLKRMIEFGCRPENARAVTIGVGSHNVFDIAYALLLRAENEVEDYVSFEMLEGMADPLRRVIQVVSGGMLLYCPVARDDEFQFAIAYLVRRLDENTAPQNFLTSLFGMIPGDDEWQEQAVHFSIACETIDQTDELPRRRQNRLKPPLRPDCCSAFDNEPDTDWSLVHNCEWAKTILRDWKEMGFKKLPLVVGGKDIFREEVGENFDPSRPGKAIFNYSKANSEDIEVAFVTAQAAHLQWSSKSVEERSQLIGEIAQSLRNHRGHLIGAMVAETGKVISEADVEVSEAVDFAEYYRRNLEEIYCLEDVLWKSKGVVLVASPWNFPCSIPTGGIIAALAAGNSVIFKPAPESILTGYVLCQALWDAGVDRNLVQFITCDDEPIGSLLIQDSRLSMVVMTGATETAKKFLSLRPGIDLSAETGGKNSIIVTAMADRDLAVKNIVQSAFGHSGQKCSACSLVICEEEVYNDPHFRGALYDAAKSLKVGSQWDTSTKVNPLIRTPLPQLKKALTTLEDGEEWLLEPKQDPQNPQIWSPGIKLGVKPGGFTHTTEFFGPLLGVMKADNLDHAIQLANGTIYGLTAGLQTLDDREQTYWLDRIEAGNCYINRGITGAIVQRQPFGGCKQSSFGHSYKAGGPNYLMQFMHSAQDKLPSDLINPPDHIQTLTTFLSKSKPSKEDLALWNASLGSYTFYWTQYFQKAHDASKLIGQDNFLKYVPEKKLTVRISHSDSLLDVLRVVAAGSITGALLEISVDPEQGKQLPNTLPAGIKLSAESEVQFAERVTKKEISKFRLLSNAAEVLLEAAAKAGCVVLIDPVLANGRVELLHCLREVAISNDYHRYGYLGLREAEKRKPLPSPEEVAASNTCMSSTCKCG